ncbi:MAG: hypothetical protein JST54_35565 [Deltaproteobacteria bacterium]|nr:hypothetical protein [Deltaproteobacteria bacterium]
MSWPELDTFVPAPLRGGPIPPDVNARANREFRESWQRYVARRVHGAEERALALVVDPATAAPYAFVFDGRSCEAASPALGSVLAAMTGLPKSGMLMKQGANAIWRESLSADQAAARWRALGGDEAFALEPVRHSGRVPTHELNAYAIVRRGQDRVRVELSRDLDLPANAAIRAWAQRLLPFVRPDLREALGG